MPRPVLVLLAALVTSSRATAGTEPSPEFQAALARVAAAEVELRAAGAAPERALVNLMDATLHLAAVSSPEEDARRLDEVVDAILLLAHLAPEGREGFEEAETVLLDAVPRTAGPTLAALTAAPWHALVALPAEATSAELVATLATAGVRVNPYLDAVDGLGERARALRPVQPAVVRVWGDGSGTGVNVDPAGLVLTNAHLPERVGAGMFVEFPDGSRYRASCERLDAARDLALLRVEGGLALPVARLAPSPPVVGDPIVIIGHPGGQNGHPPPFRVIGGSILAMRPWRDGRQTLGATAHDAETEEGHSGSPLFDAAGHIVALHNSFDPRTGVRHAVSWEAMRSFLGDDP